MKFALLGYGKMGKMVEEVAKSQGHVIVCRLNSEKKERQTLKEADVCIDFSHPNAVLENIALACEFKKPIVVGTTGWNKEFATISAMIQKADIALAYSPNFSLGMHRFFRLVQEAAKRCSQYTIYGSETHHQHKVDAPSGTALHLSSLIQQERGQACPFESIREGNAPGTHTLVFDSPCDTITLTHVAKGRLGFAEGAVAAAEWIYTKKGVHLYEA